MPKVKLTKTELKAQKDALSRYRKFLPMLQLKKSQLQMELGGMRAREADLARREEELLEGVKPWIGLLADAGVPVPVELERVRTRAGNIAIKAAKFAFDQGPVEEGCDCPCCRGFSRSYIRHLLNCNEILG